MGSITVRLDDDAEAALQEIQARSQTNISETIKLALQTQRDALRAEDPGDFWAFYQALDVGKGSKDIPASDSGSDAVADAIFRNTAGN